MARITAPATAAAVDVPVMAGSIDFTSWTPTTYTSAGPHVNGGITFTLTNCDATNTVVVDASGWKVVGGSATVQMVIADLAQLGVSVVDEPVEVVVEHGAIAKTAAATSLGIDRDGLGTDYAVCQIQGGTGNALLFSRAASTFSTTATTAISGTSVHAHSVYLWGRTAKGAMHMDADPGQVDMESLNLDLGDSTVSGTAYDILDDVSSAAISFHMTSNRGIYVTRLTVWALRYAA